MVKAARKSSIAATDARNSTGNFRTRFSLPSFLKQVTRLSDNQRAALEKLGFGNLLLIPNQRLNKNLLDELMRRWDIDRQAFLLPEGEIRLTLLDIALILGLRVVGSPVILNDKESFIDLESKYGAVIWKRKITVSSLESKLDSFGGICDDDFVRTFLLYTFGTFLFPNANGTVDSRYLSLLKDVDNICQFAWGAAVLKDLFSWLHQRKMMNVQYVGGCLLFLQMWSFEHIDIARPSLLGSSFAFPRVCQWDKSRSLNRQQIVSKFKDLQDHQVTWELQPTSLESEVGIIKELLEAQSTGKEHSEAENSCIVFPIVTDNDLGAIPQTMNPLVIEVETGSERSSMNEGQSQRDINLDKLADNVSEVFTDVIECPSTSGCISKMHKQPKPVALPNDASVIIVTGDEEDLRTRVRMLEEKNMELEKEIHELRREKGLVRNNMLSGPQLEEKNIQLMREIDELRRENQCLSLSANELVVRLEKLVFDEDISVSEDSKRTQD
ncbi:Aminotransferase-like mobile domain containing protein [Parasponia andersonii]|uniref:Aminotransferase-like mobile domain containing protein n=1 Tax=Parasponia andersonii TaxID=3476 RepID=A0A2P5BS12_PARAD|nr:Aminotransferase-like mobile domain containing protein [Parasponia andersonii]